MRLEDSADCCAQSPRAGGVMRDIEDPFRFFLVDGVLVAACRLIQTGDFLDPFQASGPARKANTILDCGGSNREPVMLRKLDGCGDGEGDVPLLVRSRQW